MVLEKHNGSEAHLTLFHSFLNFLSLALFPSFLPLTIPFSDFFSSVLPSCCLYVLPFLSLAVSCASFLILVSGVFVFLCLSSDWLTTANVFFLSLFLSLSIQVC